jgi:hypothetical protein
MKTLNQLKVLYLIVPLAILNIKAFGQNTSFAPDAKKDSICIAESVITANKLHPILLDSSGSMRGKWISGKILYSPDGLLRTTQLIGDNNFFTTTIEYIYQHKIFKQDLNYKSDFSNYPLTRIYRLPGKSPAYLFLLSEREALPDYEHDPVTDFLKISDSPGDADFKHLKKITNVASVLRLDRDSLSEVAFPPTMDDDDEDQLGNAESIVDTVKTDGPKSLGFISDIKQSQKFPKPFLKYDPLAHTLRFLDIYYKIDAAGDIRNTDFLRVHSGSFDYKDSLFVLTKDTFYYYPSLAAAGKILARKNYKAGKYIINAMATKSYVDFGEVGILPVLTTKYKIGNQTLTSLNNDDYDGGNKVDITPDYRIQNNSSLILLLTDQTNGHGSGMCGAADYFYSHFSLITSNNKTPQQLFSFSYGSCSSDVKYYTFTKNGEEVTRNFYVANLSDEHNAYFQESYWKNNSTYVFVFSTETNLSRNFYLHFNVLNKKAPVTLKAGKLYEAKKQTSQLP